VAPVKSIARPIQLEIDRAQQLVERDGRCRKHGSRGSKTRRARDAAGLGRFAQDSDRFVQDLLDHRPAEAHGPVRQFRENHALGDLAFTSARVAAFSTVRRRERRSRIAGCSRPYPKG
jgi:hypothetical protein